MGAADDFLDGKLNADKFLDAPKAEAMPSNVAANLASIDRQQEAAKIEEPTTFAYLFNRLKKGVAGFMGVPGDALQMVRTAPGAPTTPGGYAAAERAGVLPTAAQGTTANDRINAETRPLVATSGQYRDIMGYDSGMKTGSDMKRYAGGVAEMVGAGGPFALSGKAAQIPAIAMGSVGSGIGMEAGGDIASGIGVSREAGEVAGALAGGVVSAVTPNVLTAAGGMVRRRLSPDANKAAAESQVGKEIAGQLESYPPAAGNIERSLQISDEIPGFTPSLPARSGAPGLLAEEKRLVSQNPKTLNRAVQNVEDNQRAVKEYVETKFPKVGGETAADRIERLRTMATGRLETIRGQIDEKLDDSLRVFESNPTNYENGNRLRDLFFKQKDVYSGMRSQKYQEVYDTADRLGVKANIDDEVSYVKDILKSEMNAYQQSEIPSVFRTIKAEFAPDAAKSGPTVKATPTGKTIKHYDTAPAEAEPADVSFQKLHSLYKRTNADLASLRGSSAADKDFRIHLLDGLKDKLLQNLARFEDQGYGEVAAKLKEANRFYAEEYLPRFKQGFGGDVAAKYPTGEFRTPDQLVTELITKKPNNTQAAKDFKLLFDEVPEAWQSLRNGYMDELYRNGGVVSKDGRMNQRSLETFLRKHEPTLAQFPEIKKELQQLALDNGALLERRAYIVNAEKQLAANDLYRLFQGKDPDVILSEATTNPNAMRALAYTARNEPNMQKGLARGIAEHVTAQTDPGAFLAANEKAIREGLKSMGEEHFKNLRTAVEAMTINSRSQMPTNINAGAAVPDAMAEKLGSSPRAIISHILNVERGRTGVVQEGAAFLGRWFDKLRRDHKAVAMESVFYSKDAAKALADLAKNPHSQRAQMGFVNQMTSLGVRAEVAGQE